MTKLTADAEAAYRRQEYAGRARIDGVTIVDLKRFNDDGGAMTELGRLDDGRLADMEGFRVAQINYSTLEPGVIKAFHVHRRQTDVWYVPPEDRILLVLVDTREDSPTRGACQRLMLGDFNSRLVRIPPGVAHGCRNLGSTAARVVYFTDQHFYPEPGRTDEGRLPWDLIGKEVWDPSRE
jgi:dTDP-4-dehydrorhamnose 3,5-epimerase